MRWLRQFVDGGRRTGRGREPTSLAPSPDESHVLEQLRQQFQRSPDVKFNAFRLGEKGPEGVAVYVEGLVDTARLEETTLRPILSWAQHVQGIRGAVPGSQPSINLRTLQEQVPPAMEARLIDDLEEATAAVLSGDTLLFLKGEPAALHITNRGPQSRGVQDPVLEVTVRGPRDSFTETLVWNTALVRRRLRDPGLRIVLKKIGRRSRTDVALLYIEGIAPEGLVAEVERRLDGIDIDAILDTGYIEQLIEDAWLSPFPQHLKTERPDKVVAGLLIVPLAIL